MTQRTERETMVRIGAGTAMLEGSLVVPAEARGLVVFAHGSGSSRHSPRNRFVAQQLRERATVATLLVDLLSAAEGTYDEQTSQLRFDIRFLADRLLAATAWATRYEETRPLPIGYFGASTGAGAALVAAADRPGDVAAVVSRGGRADMAGDALRDVRAPTLLIVGGADEVVLDLNRAALAQLAPPSALEVVPNATHLFEERGALDVVARLAAHWFATYLNTRA